jgi:hypothetical protein
MKRLRLCLSLPWPLAGLRLMSQMRSPRTRAATHDGRWRVFDYEELLTKAG